MKWEEARKLAYEGIKVRGVDTWKGATGDPYVVAVDGRLRLQDSTGYDEQLYITEESLSAGEWEEA